MIQLLILLIIVGALLFLSQRLPIDGTIKLIIQVVVICAVAIYLLKHLAVLGL